MGSLFRFVFRALFGRRSKIKARSREARLPPEPFEPVAQEAPVSALPEPAQEQLAELVHALPPVVTGRCYVIDGDTIQIGTVRLRLAGVDAPELDHPWGKKAKSELMNLCKGQVVRAEISPELSYDRVVATCFLPDGRDLSAEMVQRGLALDWPKFSGGKYAHLEPEGARKKHWKAAARQRGHLHVFHK